MALGTAGSGTSVELAVADVEAVGATVEEESEVTTAGPWAVVTATPKAPAVTAVRTSAFVIIVASLNGLVRNNS